MRINGIDMNHMHNDAHFQFHTEFRDLMQRENPVTLNVGDMFDVYKKLFAREDDGLKRIVKSVFTERIRKADKDRDETFAAILDLNKAMCKHFNPAIKEAANRVKVVLDTYGNVTAKPLNEQTSAVYNLLQELNDDKYIDDRINTNLNPWVNELKNRNEEFERLVKERFDEEAARTPIIMRDARKELDECYKKIVEKINALAIVEGEAKYENFMLRLNAVILKYSQKKHARKKRKPETAEK